MQNAHLRMGRLEFSTSPGRNSTGIQIKLPLDRVIVEPAGERDSSARCHMASIFGGDQDVAAVAAALAEGSRFIVEGPDISRAIVTFGENAKVFRSSIAIPGRTHAVRHLVAISEELSLTQAGAGSEAQRTVLCDDSPRFILYRLAVRFGLPVLPEWSEWVVGELHRRSAVTPLIGLNCGPVLVSASKASLLGLVSVGLRRGSLAISDGASTVKWDLAGRFIMSESPVVLGAAEE
jgi:hypothetical protein